MKYERLTRTSEMNNYCSYTECGEECKSCYVGKLYERLAELEDKIENETLIELPCKVGDMVFMPWAYDGTSGIAFNTIREFVVSEKGLFVKVGDWDSDILYPVYYKISYLGNLLYLTRAEAEAKLKEYQNEQTN